MTKKILSIFIPVLVLLAAGAYTYQVHITGQWDFWNAPPSEINIADTVQEAFRGTDYYKNLSKDDKEYATLSLAQVSRASLVLAAIKGHYVKTGMYPATLEEIEFIEDKLTLIDPLTGERFYYRLREEEVGYEFCYRGSERTRECFTKNGPVQ
ncbi:MAG: hypothetical protein ABA06_03880 [Parcubacteria bacterium C7867-001]|nr:MAG: hypothetical protein ABA06_03880 [Parcubacteria bacterium C7867-001]